MEIMDEQHISNIEEVTDLKIIQSEQELIRLVTHHIEKWGARGVREATSSNFQNSFECSNSYHYELLLLSASYFCDQFQLCDWLLSCDRAMLEAVVVVT